MMIYLLLAVASGESRSLAELVSGPLIDPTPVGGRSLGGSLAGMGDSVAELADSTFTEVKTLTKKGVAELADSTASLVTEVKTLTKKGVQGLFETVKGGVEELEKAIEAKVVKLHSMITNIQPHLETAQRKFETALITELIAIKSSEEVVKALVRETLPGIGKGIKIGVEDLEKTLKTLGTTTVTVKTGRILTTSDGSTLSLTMIASILEKANKPDSTKAEVITSLEELVKESNQLSKSNTTTIIIVSVVVGIAVLGAAGGAYWYFSRKSKRAVRKSKRARR